MIWIYCKTVDDPKDMGLYVCKSNFEQENLENKYVLKDESEDDCWIIETDNQNETSAIIYRIGPEIVAIEIDENCASTIIETLMKKYGFNNVKWFSTK